MFMFTLMQYGTLLMADLKESKRRLLSWRRIRGSAWASILVKQTLRVA